MITNIQQDCVNAISFSIKSRKYLAVLKKRAGLEVTQRDLSFFKRFTVNCKTLKDVKHYFGCDYNFFRRVIR